MAEDRTTWRKSSFTGNNDCVEVAFSTTEVAVRDSKQATGPQLHFNPAQWHIFLADARWARSAAVSLARTAT